MAGNRMSNSRDTGVVNKDCRLHESPNLYVVSSSMCSTGGWANPNATIIAFSLRLADHLKSVLDERLVRHSKNIQFSLPVTAQRPGQLGKYYA